jgi:hypothetical protein
MTTDSALPSTKTTALPPLDSALLGGNGPCYESICHVLENTFIGTATVLIGRWDKHLVAPEIQCAFNG